jgi:Rrf2 family transcriptional regulator, cysteine metabolism repressor
MPQMPISKRCEHGLKAAVQLALRYEEGYVQARELAKTEDLPAKFIEAVLLQMRLAGLLESKVGAGGGYRLTKPPAQVQVQDLLDVFSSEALLLPDEESQDCEQEPLTTPGARAVAGVIVTLCQAMRASLADLKLSDLLDTPEDLPKAPCFHI